MLTAECRKLDPQDFKYPWLFLASPESGEKPGLVLGSMAELRICGLEASPTESVFENGRIPLSRTIALLRNLGLGSPM